jgi:hypothetical protein
MAQVIKIERIGARERERERGERRTLSVPPWPARSSQSASRRRYGARRRDQCNRRRVFPGIGRSFPCSIRESCLARKDSRPWVYMQTLHAQLIFHSLTIPHFLISNSFAALLCSSLRICDVPS